MGRYEMSQGIAMTYASRAPPSSRGLSRRARADRKRGRAHPSQFPIHFHGLCHLYIITIMIIMNPNFFQFPDPAYVCVCVWWPTGLLFFF